MEPLAHFKKNQKNDEILFGGVAIIARAHFVPGVDVAVDVTLCIVGAAMYASAGPGHRENVGKGKQAKRLCDRNR